MASPNFLILLVESDTTLGQRMSTDLQEAGYATALAHNFSQGIQQTAQLQPALIVIDLMTPDDLGFKLCQQLRRNDYRNPVLMLMAQDGLDDRVACIESGADDYFLKPYRSEDFLKLLHLHLKPDIAPNEQLRFSDLTLDLTSRQVFRSDRGVDLTMKEFELLKYLMEHPREVLTREQILENVWGYEFMGESNVIEVYIRYLRLKIEDGGEKRLIQTVRGVGYVLREP
jgi:DNA-binding response OmpR family regulator